MGKVSDKALDKSDRRVHFPLADRIALSMAYCCSGRTASCCFAGRHCPVHGTGFGARGILLAFACVGFAACVVVVQKGFSFEAFGFGGGCLYGNGDLGHVPGRFFVMGFVGDRQAFMRSADKPEKKKCLACHLHFACADSLVCALSQDARFNRVAFDIDADSLDSLHVFFCVG